MSVLRLDQTWTTRWNEEESFLFSTETFVHLIARNCLKDRTGSAALAEYCTPVQEFRTRVILRCACVFDDVALGEFVKNGTVYEYTSRDRDDLRQRPTTS